MAPRKTTTIEEDNITDPINQAISADRENLASELGEVLDGLGAIASDKIKGIVYKTGRGNGKYEWIKEVYPPFDTNELMSWLQEEYGGGEYQLRLMVEGKIKKNFGFSIIEKKTSLLAPPSNGNQNDMLAMIMQMNQSSKSDMMAMMTMMMQSQQASAAAQSQLMGILIPAMMGSKEKTSELLQSFATLSGAGDKGGGLKESIEILTLAKGLFAGGDNSGSSYDPDGDMVSNVLKIGGPILGSIGKAFSERASQPQQTLQVLPMQPNSMPGQEQLALIPPVIPTNIDAPVMPVPEGVTGRFPVLDLIKEDVLFFFRRQYDPTVAAENVLDILDKNNVQEEALTDVIAAFSISPNWVEDLAGEGIDLRADPTWANTFLSTLVQLYTSPDDGDDSSERGSGGQTDNGAHGATVSERVDRHAGQGDGGQADTGA